MELRHLRYFVVLAEELHFGRAAERLHIVQPTISRQISRLEQDLGVALFHRTKRSVRLTEAGRVLLEEARQLLERSEEAILKTRRAAAGEAGTLCVGLTGSSTYIVLSKVLPLHQERFPNVRIAPREMNTSVQLEALREGSIEVGFVRLPVGFEGRDLDIFPFFREPMGLALAKSHRLAKLKQVPLRELSDEPFVMPSREREPGWREHVAGPCERAGFVPKVVQETTEVQVGVMLVASGVGVTIVPASSRKFQTPATTYRKLEEPAPTTVLSVASRKDSRSPTADAFLETAKELSNL